MPQNDWTMYYPACRKTIRGKHEIRVISRYFPGGDTLFTLDLKQAESFLEDLKKSIKELRKSEKNGKGI